MVVYFPKVEGSTRKKVDRFPFFPKMALSHCFREKLLLKTNQRGQTSKRKQKCKQKVPPDHATKYEQQKAQLNQKARKSQLTGKTLASTDHAAVRLVKKNKKGYDQSMNKNTFLFHRPGFF